MSKLASFIESTYALRLRQQASFKRDPDSRFALLPLLETLDSLLCDPEKVLVLRAAPREHMDVTVGDSRWHNVREVALGTLDRKNLVDTSYCAVLATGGLIHFVSKPQQYWQYQNAVDTGSNTAALLARLSDRQTNLKVVGDSIVAEIYGVRDRHAAK